MITGKQISEARKRKGLTQAALADLIEVSQEAVSKWERDAYSPSTEKEERLYHVLGIPFLEDDGTLASRISTRMHRERSLRFCLPRSVEC